jgi:hypothetical protein
VRVLFVLAVLSALGLGGCTTVYVNDPDLAKQADAADTAVQGADTLKPYSTQLANLQAYSAQQDLAVANRDVATRDGVVTSMLDDTPADSLAALDKDACKRLEALVVSEGLDSENTCADKHKISLLSSFFDRAGSDSRVIDEDQQTVEATRAAYERVRTDPKIKDDCETLRTATLSPSFGIDGPGQLYALQDDCRQLDLAQQGLKGLVDGLGLGPDSALTAAYRDAQPPAPRPKTTTSEQDQQLEDEIQRAKDLAKGGDLKSLADFQAEIEDILKDSSGAAQLVGLTRVQQALAGVLSGTLCSPPPASGVDCKSLAVASTAGRAAAVWSLLEAIAQTMDANDPRLRSANWLAAANAILTAEKANATIQANAEAEAVASAKTRFTFLARAASGFAKVDLASPPKPSCPGADPWFCGLAAYLSAWNDGLIPADIYAYRETLIFSRTVLQQQLAAQTEQQGLSRAASASLKAYADGGIQPSAIAQLIVDAGLFGVAAAK